MSFIPKNGIPFNGSHLELKKTQKQAFYHIGVLKFKKNFQKSACNE